MILQGTTSKIGDTGLWEAQVTAYDGTTRLFSMALARTDKYNAQVELEAWAKENGHEVTWNDLRV